MIWYQTHIAGMGCERISRRKTAVRYKCAYKLSSRDFCVETDADLKAGHSLEVPRDMHCPLCCAVASVGRTDSRERLMTVCCIPLSLCPWPFSDGAALMRAILVTDVDYSSRLQHRVMNWCLGRNSKNSVFVTGSRQYRLICTESPLLAVYMNRWMYKAEKRFERFAGVSILELKV